MIGTITLNPSIDQHILVENLVKDDANRAKSIRETPGGKGINVSKAVRELGGQTRAYALLGGFPGQYLKELAKLLDTEVGRIRQSVGAIGDIRQLVMAGLMVADRLSEATRKMEVLESDNQTLRESRNAALGQIKSMEDNFSRALDIAAEKLEELAK